ncbi:MAG: restriction endonuclease subunit S [Methylobacter sp.]
MKEGDILFSHINSPTHLGKTAIYYKDQHGDLIHGMNLLCLRANQEKVYPKYLNYAINAPDFKSQLPKITKKAVNQASIAIADLKELEIPLPPILEQKRIAAILDKADSLRRKNQQAIQLADKFLRAVFLDMFGDPVTNPKGWEIEKFVNVGALDRGKSKHRPRNDPILLGGDHPLIQTGDVANSCGYIKTFSSTYSDIGLQQSRKWPTGTLCITIAANIAKTGILTFDACFPDSVVGFIPGEKVTTEYVQHWLKFLQKTLEAAAPESAQKNINLEILRNLSLPLPDKTLQEKFSIIVNGVLNIENNLDNMLSRNLFNALSQKAFAGEL